MYLCVCVQVKLQSGAHGVPGVTALSCVERVSRKDIECVLDGQTVLEIMLRRELAT